MNSNGFILTEFTDNESDNEDGKVCDNECDDKECMDENKWKNLDVATAAMKMCDNECEQECVDDKCNEKCDEKCNKDLYVICKNNIPITFCDNKSNAGAHILKLAWEEKGLNLINNSDYNYYIVIENHSLIYLYSKYKNWLLSYDKILCEFSYHKIKSLNK